ncbi:MAG TPA: transketolase C-terminal domain-containing protein [Anaeromyxobacter sp.]|nr:transketolase C-terminal domain-containing protein [Anaeromyxobacter sp.]
MSDAITAVMTGNEAAATAARLARVQVVAAYPITPQSPVVETLCRWVEEGELEAEFVRVESEHSALTVCIAAASIGARTFTATSANGLAYMNEQIWWAAGARLPLVLCCANRAMAAPWNVLNDQQDSMSVRDAGWVQLYCRDNQEILDTTLQAYRLAESLQVPVMVCYDGFLLSHTVAPVAIPSEAAVDEFLPRGKALPVLDLSDPRNVGPVTLADPRPDSRGVLCHGYMEFRALHHRALGAALQAIPEVDRAFAGTFGRSWGGLTFGHLLEDAEVALVAAGSLAAELSVVAEALRGEGIRAGVLGIRAYRPFPREAVRAALAGKRLCQVFDKAVSYGHEGPICSDLRGALAGVAGAPPVFGAIVGLGGRDVTTATLAGAVRRAVADLVAGVRDRPEEWVDLRL